MCGRFTLRTSAESLASLFAGLSFPPLVPRYNIAPTQEVLCLRESPNGSKEAVFLRWGLVPAWAQDLKIGAHMINARAETVATKPAFRSAYRHRRCLILADGFYEWQKSSNGKQPYYIKPTHRPLFCFAGLWESWADSTTPKSDNPKSTNIIQTCSIITTAPNDLMATIHDRMPVILDEPGQQLWINRDSSSNVLQQLLIPCPITDIRIDPVGKQVNKAGNNDPGCIEPIVLET